MFCGRLQIVKEGEDYKVVVAWDFVLAVLSAKLTLY